MQHFPQFQFLISDPGGCFVSNELREWARIRGIGLLTAPDEFHGLTAGFSCVLFHTTMVSRLEDTRQFNGQFGADNEGHGVTTTMPSEIETVRMSAMNRDRQEQAKGAIRSAQHTIRKENVNLEPGTWVVHFRRGKVT